MADKRSLFDLFGDRDGEGLYFSPRTFGDNIPYRGVPDPSVRRETLEELPIRKMANVRTFDLGDPAQAFEYRVVLQRAANGRSIIGTQLHNWDPASAKMYVHCEWYDLERDGTDLPSSRDPEGQK
jgi:hypothetical protein